MMFAEYIVLVEERFKEVNGRLEEWREAIERKDLRVSRDITEYMAYDFGERKYRVDKEGKVMNLSGNVVVGVERFKYL